MSNTALRVFPRKKFELAINIVLDQIVYEGTSTDISQGGLGFTSRLKIPQGIFLWLNMDIYEKSHSFAAEVVVSKNIQEGYFYGVSFFDLSEEETETLVTHHEGIQSIIVEIILPETPMALESEDAQDFQVEMARVVSLAAHIPSILVSASQKNMDHVLNVIEEKIKTLGREYFMSYKYVRKHSENTSMPPILMSMQAEQYKLMMVHEGWYGFTGFSRKLFLCVKGPWIPSQYKIISSYIQTCEMALAQFVLFQFLNNFSEDYEKLRQHVVSYKNNADD
ncbi:MAG: PilZ domain-containing protein [SAR324 cluster bacterium]|nr:PilZ domain-containing protein [SAR324 cluster bacterium]